MRATQHVPSCPICGRPVYRTHTCRVSRMPDLPERTEQPHAPALRLVPMPEGWKDQALAGLHPVPDYDDRSELWPRPQLVEPELCECGDPAPCLHTATGYPWCDRCTEHHRHPEACEGPDAEDLTWPEHGAYLQDWSNQ